MSELSTKFRPSLTIFCSLFKGGKFIEGYMEDITSQTIFKDVTFHILDCNSPQKENEIIERYLGYDNIVYEKMHHDPGLYAAWNICVKKAKTDLVGNWNVDDRKNPWSLEVLRSAFVTNPDIDVAYGRTVVSFKENENWSEINPYLYYPTAQVHNWKDLVGNNHPHCMPVWKKSLHDRFGFFNEKYLTASDSDMWIRAAKQGAKFHLVDETIGIYFKNPDGTSTDLKNLRKMLNEVNSMRRSHYPDYVDPPPPQVLLDYEKQQNE
jgi:glycosyltransferase involved in cell wall biosynthesis